ncbi:MAG: DUF503 domain-containing protein [Aquificae bacterium]|nr:DUF503 domain-containing protein [Aquificota bacterium]
MIVGVLIIELFIPQASSLKEKRKEVRSIKDKLRSTFNVSVSEVGNLELWQRASVGVAVAGSDVNHVKETLNKLEGFIERNWSHLLLEVREEILSLD